MANLKPTPTLNELEVKSIAIQSMLSQLGLDTSSDNYYFADTLASYVQAYSAHLSATTNNANQTQDAYATVIDMARKLAAVTSRLGSLGSYSLTEAPEASDYAIHYVNRSELRQAITAVCAKA